MLSTYTLHPIEISKICKEKISNIPLSLSTFFPQYMSGRESNNVYKEIILLEIGFARVCRSRAQLLLASQKKVCIDDSQKPRTRLDPDTYDQILCTTFHIYPFDITPSRHSFFTKIPQPICDLNIMQAMVGNTVLKVEIGAGCIISTPEQPLSADTIGKFAEAILNQGILNKNNIAIAAD